MLSAPFFVKKPSPAHPSTYPSLETEEWLWKKKKIEEALTLGLNTRALIKGEVGGKKINSLGGNQLRHGVRSENV